MKKKITLLLFSLLALGGCADKPPVPEHNPVVLSWESQTVEVMVKNMGAIHPLPDSDMRVTDHQSGSSTPRVLKNEWAIVTHNYDPDKKNRPIYIEVWENKTEYARSFSFELQKKGKSVILTVVQEGKK